MNSKLFIHATNVHQGGGHSLLSALLEACPSNMQVVALLDSRMILPSGIADKFEIRFTMPSILQRIKAEWWLKQNVQPQDIVLCFGNLPPIFFLQGHVAVFVQNRYLVDLVSLKNFPIKTRLRLGVERLWLSGRANNADEFIVQTMSMRIALLSSGIVMKQSVHVRPFALMFDKYQGNVSHEKVGHNNSRYDFIYAASGDPHKNHRRLVEAWCLLAEQGIFPALCLTVDKVVSEELCTWIDEQKHRYGLKLENVGFLPRNRLLQLYVQTRALIFPSLFESFGLPLIEARQAGMPVLAAELDYVRDVLDPEQSFDPGSPISIARAVKRYLGLEEGAVQLMDAAKFLHFLQTRSS